MKPPESDYAKCEDLVIPYRRRSLIGGCPLKESNHRGSHLRRGLDISKCTLCFYSQFFLYSEQCSIYRILNSQNMHQDIGRLQEVKNNGKIINYQPRKVVVVTYRRGSSCKALIL